MLDAVGNAVLNYAGSSATTTSVSATSWIRSSVTAESTPRWWAIHPEVEGATGMAVRSLLLYAGSASSMEVQGANLVAQATESRGTRSS